MKKKKSMSWYKLDNAAKIFPPTTDKYDTKTFRFAVSLKEKIDSKILKEALNVTLKDFPIFSSVLKKGFFWYYLEESDIEPEVTLVYNKGLTSREVRLAKELIEENEEIIRERWKAIFYPE